MYENKNHFISRLICFSKKSTVCLSHLWMFFFLLETSSSSFGQTPNESFSVTKEFEFDASMVTGGDFQTPVTTFNGSIYYVYVSDQLQTIVVKKTPGGTITTNIIFSQTDNDPWHNGASIGIDKNGYIHIAGNMHNSPLIDPDNCVVADYDEQAWQYVISDNPEDISSFAFVGRDRDRTIPGTWITYPFFARDRSGELYVSFRHRVKFCTGWSEGIMAAGLARYDAANKRWTMLGGTNYRHAEKTFFWNDSGADDSAYQPYRSRIFFDKNNRMHITWVADNGNGSSGEHTHLLYAYSDNGGDSFLKADGSSYQSMPITLNTADIIVGPSWTGSNGNLWYTSYVGMSNNGRPMVSFADNITDSAWWSRWNNGWGSPTPLPFNNTPPRILIDDNGTITAVDGDDKLHRSTDNGVSWRTYEVETYGIHSTNFDYVYFSETNQLRFQTYSTSTGKVKVWTLNFTSGSSGTDTQPPASPKNLRISVEQP